MINLAHQKEILSVEHLDHEEDISLRDMKIYSPNSVIEVGKVVISDSISETSSLEWTEAGEDNPKNKPEKHPQKKSNQISMS